MGIQALLTKSDEKLRENESFLEVERVKNSELIQKMNEKNESGQDEELNKLKNAILEKEEECKRIATELEQSKIEIETFKKLQMNGLQAQNMSNYMIDSTKKQQKKMQLKTQKHGKFEANDQTEDNMQQSMKGLNAQSAVNYNVPQMNQSNNEQHRKQQQSYQQQQISYQQRWFATTIQQQQQRQFNQQQNRAQNVMNAQQQQSNNVNSNSQQSKQSNVNKKEFDLQQNNQMKQYDANSVSTTSASTQNKTQQQQPR